MYAALWRRLPGGRPAKIAQALALLAVVVVICFAWAFPLVAQHLPYQDVTVTPVDSPAAPATPVPSRPTSPAVRSGSYAPTVAPGARPATTPALDGGQPAQ